MYQQQVDKFDDYLDQLADQILHSNYTSKDELKNMLGAHFAIMIIEKEVPGNEALKKKYDSLVQHLRTLQVLKSPKMWKVQNEISVTKTALKESNRRIYNAQTLNRLINLRMFIMNKFGDNWLAEFEKLEDKKVELLIKK